MLPKNIATNCALGHHLPTDKKLAPNKKAVLRNKRSKSGPLVQNGPVRHPTPEAYPTYKIFENKIDFIEFGPTGYSSGPNAVF